jgi:hypothetical protein
MFIFILHKHVILSSYFREIFDEMRHAQYVVIVVVVFSFVVPVSRVRYSFSCMTLYSVITFLCISGQPQYIATRRVRTLPQSVRKTES